MLGKTKLYGGIFIPLLGTSLLFLPEALRVGHETKKDDLYQCQPGRSLHPGRATSSLESL